jgi:hypothetical protein
VKGIGVSSRLSPLQFWASADVTNIKPIAPPASTATTRLDAVVIKVNLSFLAVEPGAPTGKKAAIVNEGGF